MRRCHDTEGDRRQLIVVKKFVPFYFKSILLNRLWLEIFPPIKNQTSKFASAVLLGAFLMSMIKVRLCHDLKVRFFMI